MEEKMEQLIKKMTVITANIQTDPTRKRLAAVIKQQQNVTNNEDQQEEN